MRLAAVAIALVFALLIVSPAAAAGLATLMVPATAAGGTVPSGSVKLDAPAPSGGVVVDLTSSNPAVASVPASISIGSGLRSKSFKITTTLVTEPTPVTITATKGETSLSATITVVPPGLSTLSVSPTSVGGGANATGTVRLTGPAPAGGLVVALNSGNPVASLPATATIGGGLSSATFPITTSPVTASTPVALTATLGTVTKTTTLTVAPPTLSRLTLSPTSVGGGKPATGTVTLTGPAPEAGLVVSLTSSNAAATVPETVTVPGSATTTTFPITTSVVTSTTSVSVRATFGTVTKSATLSVKPTALSSVTITPTSIISGATATATVNLTGNAPASGATVQLANSVPGAASAPATVVVPAGSSSATFTVSAETVPVVTSVRITATYAGLSKSVSFSVKPNTVTSLSFDPTTVTSGQRSTATVTLASPAPDGGMFVVLTTGSTAATFNPILNIPAGEQTGTVQIQSLAVSTATNATIFARAITGASRSAVLRVEPAATMEIAAIAFWESSTVGGQQNLLDIILTKHVPAGGLVVSLESSNPAALPLPSTVFLEPGWPGATMLVTTNSVPEDTVVTVTASIPGSTQSTELTVRGASGGGGGARSADDRDGKRKRAGGALPRIDVSWPDADLVAATSVDHAAASGSVYAIARGERAKGTAGAGEAFDGREKTAWATKTPAKRASVVFDLGERRQLTAIRWLQTKPGAVEVQVSVDGKHWTAVGQGGDGAAGSWQELAVATEARYVRFVFFAGGKEARLGHLAEVELVGPDAIGDPTADQAAPSEDGTTPPADDAPANDGKGKHDGKAGKGKSHGKGLGKGNGGARRGKN